MKLHNYLKDDSWWSDTTSSLVGTVVGIILTFGTSIYWESQNKETMARKTALLTIYSIDCYVDLMQDEVNTLKNEDCIFKTVASHYPGRIAQVSKDTLQLFISSFAYLSTFAIDTSAENIFTHSIDTWKNLDDGRIINSIGDCFAGKNLFVGFLENLQRHRRGIFLDYCAEKSLLDYKSADKAVNALISRPDARYLIIEYPTYVQVLEELCGKIKELNDRNKQIMEVTEEEMEALKAFGEE